MNNLFFWNNWTKPYRLLYTCFLVLFAACTFFFIYSEYSAKNLGLNWDIETEAKTTKIVVDKFQKGFFEFGVQADNHYFFQTYTGTLTNSQDWFSYIILAAMFILLVSGSVTISYTKGIWYLLSLTCLAIFFFLLNLDVLEVLNMKNMYWTTGSFLVFGLLIHYFHAFKPLVPLVFRYGIFSVLSGTFLYATISFSSQDNALELLTSYGILAPLAISILYIIITATDILSGFLFLTTDSRNAKKMSSLLNFILVSLFFLGNVALTLMKNRSSIDWKIIYIEAPIILIISSILGIWAHKKKEPIYSFIADFSPASAIWFLAMTANCFLCYAFLNLSANDTLQEVLEDSVIFSQMCFGIMFVIFVIANFMGLMEQNLPAHMVIYKPKYMPFGFVRIIGIILIFSLVMYNSQYQSRQFQAGYYIGIGETYLKNNNLLLGEEYLRNALAYDQGNHKANYVLGILTHQKDKDDPTAKVYLKQALFKKPSPQAYATLGNYFLRDGDIIRSIEILKEGYKTFPNSKEVLNNLGLAFNRTDIKDSTFFYLQKANAISEGTYVPMANQLAFAIQNNISPTLDTANIPEDYVYKSNLLALLTKANSKIPKQAPPSFLNDTVLTPQHAAYLLNLSFNNLKDTAYFKTSWLDSLLTKPANTHYQEELLLSKAFREYYSGNVAEGIMTMDHLCTIGSDVVRNYNILSNWLIQQDAPRVAVDFLEKAKYAGDLNASFGIAIATSYYLSGKDALAYWQDPILQKDGSFSTIANALLTKSANVYTIGILPQLFAKTDELVQAYTSLPESNEKTKALARLMQHLNDIGHSSLAIKVFNSNTKSAESEWQYLRALRKTNQKELALNANTKITAYPSDYIYAWASSDEKKKETLFKQALKTSPIFEEGVVDAIDFLQTKLKKEEIYDLLLQSVMLNQYSVPIQKAYTMACVNMNLFGATDYSLAKLKDLMNKSEYDLFASQVKRKQEEILNNMEWK